jgi:hypothetical protein
MTWNKETIKQPATQEQFDLFEKKFDKKLPNKLKELYLISNGGELEKTFYGDIFDDSINLFIDGLLPIEKFKTLKSWANEVEFAFEEEDWNIAIIQIDDLIVIAAHGWDYFTCLDYRENKSTPKLCVYDTANEPIELVSFDSFDIALQNLKSEEDFDAALEDTIIDTNEHTIKETLFSITDEMIENIKLDLHKKFNLHNAPTNLVEQAIKNTLQKVYGKGDKEHFDKVVLLSATETAKLLHNNK